MDLSQHNPESSSSNSEQVLHEASSSSPTPRNLRSSARVKAAKEKEKEKERELESEDRSAVATDVAGPSRSTPQSNQSKRPRAISTSKGKGKETEEQAARPSKKYVALREPYRPSSWLPQSPPGYVPSPILWVIYSRTSPRYQRQEACVTRSYLRRRYICCLLFNP
jgi:E3 ubiquitin-protein ligase TRIP12